MLLFWADALNTVSHINITRIFFIDGKILIFSQLRIFLAPKRLVQVLLTFWLINSFTFLYTELGLLGHFSRYLQSFLIRAKSTSLWHEFVKSRERDHR
jgi:hypothetical protein